MLALNTLLLAFPAPRDRDPPDKGPGFLGVTFEGNEFGIRVTEVRTDGPALGAGLKADDIVVKFDGEPIHFESFAAKIIRIRPGTLVPLEVRRGSETLTIKVCIGVRPEDFPYPLPMQEVQPPQEDLLPPQP